MVISPSCAVRVQCYSDSTMLKLDLEDDEEEVLKKITSEDTDENGDILGFPQLKNVVGLICWSVLQTAET